MCECFAYKYACAQVCLVLKEASELPLWIKTRSSRRAASAFNWAIYLSSSNFNNFKLRPSLQLRMSILSSPGGVPSWPGLSSLPDAAVCSAGGWQGGWDCRPSLRTHPLLLPVTVFWRKPCYLAHTLPHESRPLQRKQKKPLLQSPSSLYGYET